MEIMTITPILSIIILFLLMVIMIVLYCKIRRFIVILMLFLFSLIIGIDSLKQGIIPFSPYIQIFFLLFQTIIFLIVAIETNKVYKKS